MKRPIPMFAHAAFVLALLTGTTLPASKSGPSKEFPVAVSPDGKLIASGNVGFKNSWIRSVRIIDMKSRQEVRRLTVPNKEGDILMSLVFSPDGKWLAWGAWGQLHVFDVATGKRIWKLNCYRTNIVALAFSPDSRQIAANSGEQIAVWDLSKTVNNTPASRTIPHSGRVRSLAYSPDGKWLASCSRNDIYLWNPASGQQVQDIRFRPAESGKTVTEYASCLAFSPDSKMLLVGGDSRLRLLRTSPAEDPPQEREVRRVEAKTTFFQVQFAPDGKTFAARDYGSVKTYDLETGKKIATFVSPVLLQPRNGYVTDLYEDYIHNFAITPNGEHLIMSYGRKGLGIWSFTTPSIAPIATIAASPKPNPDNKTSAEHRFVVPSLLRAKAVHAELKLDDAQRNRVLAEMDRSRDQLKVLRGKLSALISQSRARRKQVDEIVRELADKEQALRETFAARLATFIRPDQMRRLSEISVQLAVVSSDYFPFDLSLSRYGEFWHALGVTSQQRTRLASLYLQTISLPPRRPSKGFLEYWLASSRKILSDEQSQRLQKWMGEPFDLERLRGDLPLRHFASLEKTPAQQVSAADEAQASSASDVLKNGSFEHRESGTPPANVETFAPGSGGLSGWAVVGKSVDWIGPARWQAADGKHCLDLDGGVQQRIQTVIGQSYEVRFDLAGNPELNEIAQQTLHVLVDDRRHEFIFDSTGKSTKNLGWTTKRVVFTANTQKTTLTFVNAKPNGYSVGVALDNIAVRRLDERDTETEARRAYLEKQIAGLLEETAALRKAGRIEEAKQHEKKAAYRRRQLEDLVKGKKLGPLQKAVQPIGDDKVGWSPETRGLRIKLEPTKEAYAVGEDVTLQLLIRNVSDKPKQLWQEFDAARKQLSPAVRFTLVTPEGNSLNVRRPIPFPRVTFEWTPPKPVPRRTLKPGETFRGNIVLNKCLSVHTEKSGEIWRKVRLEDAGKYTVHVVYHDFYPFYLKDGTGPYGVISKTGLTLPALLDVESKIPKEREQAAKKIRLKSPPSTFAIVDKKIADKKTAVGGKKAIDKKNEKADRALPEARGLQLQLQPTKQEYGVGEDITLELLIRNVSDKPKLLWQFTDRKQFIPAVYLMMTAPDRKTTTLRKLFLPIQVSREWTPPDPIPRRNVKVGETVRLKIVLNNWMEYASRGYDKLDISKLGKYTLRAAYFDFYPRKLRNGQGPYASLRPSSSELLIVPGSIEEGVWWHPGLDKRHKPMLEQIVVESLPATVTVVAARPDAAKQNPSPANAKLPDNKRAKTVGVRTDLEPQQKQESVRNTTITAKADDDDKLWSNTVDGLKMRLELPKDTFTVGEDIPAVIVLKNVSDKTVYYWGHHLPTLGAYPESYPTVSFEVVDPAGKRFFVGKVTLVSRQARLPKLHMLKAGATVQQVVSLNKLYKGFSFEPSFKMTGHYTVRCFYNRTITGTPFGFLSEDPRSPKTPRLISPPAQLTIAAALPKEPRK